jgi:hypothetical protein
VEEYFIQSDALRTSVQGKTQPTQPGSGLFRSHHGRCEFLSTKKFDFWFDFMPQNSHFGYELFTYLKMKKKLIDEISDKSVW